MAYCDPCAASVLLFSLPAPNCPALKTPAEFLPWLGETSKATKRSRRRLYVERPLRLRSSEAPRKLAIGPAFRGGGALAGAGPLRARPPPRQRSGPRWPENAAPAALPPDNAPRPQSAFSDLMDMHIHLWLPPELHFEHGRQERAALSPPRGRHERRLWLPLRRRVRHSRLPLGGNPDPFERKERSDERAVGRTSDGRSLAATSTKARRASPFKLTCSPLGLKAIVTVFTLLHRLCSPFRAPQHQQKPPTPPTVQEGRQTRSFVSI